MPQNYTPEFKKKIVRLHEEEGRTYKSITAEYGVSKASISKWCSQLREECQTSPETKEEYDYMKERLSAYRKTTVSRRVCQVKCVNFFDFIWRSVFDRHIYTIKSNQMVVLLHCDTLRIKVTYHDL